MELHVPATLREAVGLAYMHRGRDVRWLLGHSQLLNIDVASFAFGAYIIDARKIPDLRAMTNEPGRATVGVLVPPADVGAHPEIAPQFFPDGRVTRLRLCALDARLLVAGAGATRHVALEAAFSADGSLALAANEAPVAVDLHAMRAGFGVAERRLATKDGAASFSLELHVRMRLTSLGRIEGPRIFLAVDGGPPLRAREAEARLDRREPEPEALSEAARLTAAGVDPSNLGAAAAARAIPMTVMGAFKDALEQCAQGYRPRHEPR